MRRDGSLKLQGRQPHLSEALAGEAAGLVEEELEQFCFCDYQMAVLDAAQRRLWGVGSADPRPASIQAGSAADKVSTISPI